MIDDADEFDPHGLVGEVLLIGLCRIKDAILLGALPAEAIETVEPLIRRMVSGAMNVHQAEMVGDVADLAIDGALSDPLTMLRDLADFDAFPPVGRPVFEHEAAPVPDVTPAQESTMDATTVPARAVLVAVALAVLVIAAAVLLFTRVASAVPVSTPTARLIPPACVTSDPVAFPCPVGTEQAGVRW